MARSKSSLPGGVRTSDLVSLGTLAKAIPSSVVTSALAESGKSTVRNRTLPAELTALYCMMLWLYRDVSYEEVLECLTESWRWLNLPGSGKATKGAITQARDRLGEEPMRLIFNKIARPLAQRQTPGAWYRDWRLVAVDGSLLDTPDSKANREAFGGPSNQFGDGSFPQVRTVILCECGTHAPLACAIGSYRTSEMALLRELKIHLNPEMLLLADRYYFGAEFWKEIVETGCALLWRLRSDAPISTQSKLADGSYLAKVRDGGEGYLVRLICYETGAGTQVTLATNILDPEQGPAIELARLYCERWEVEGAFDEIKSHINETRRSVRSKKPELVRQEIWGLMILHWALRELMHEAAVVHNRDPDTISFSRTVRLVKILFTKDGAFSP
jgi:hypothetical protein